MTKSASEQQQFLTVIDRDLAEQRWRSAFEIAPCGTESVPLVEAHGRVLAEDVVSAVDVPGFDRSNLDGFAVRAADTYGAEEEQPVSLELLPEVIATAVTPASEVGPGQAITIATGGMLPRGADAIVMVEHTEVTGASVQVMKPVTPGRGVTFAGTDIARGEVVYRQGDLLTSRETGALAAVGIDCVMVRRRPQVGIISTGDEIIPPGQAMTPGMVYDSNAQVLADAIRELGGAPVRLGIVSDSAQDLRARLQTALQQCDLVLLSGGTSKGAGDICYQVVQEFDDPGIVAHGVALKPGKPICLAATGGKPLVILPGFPTSAIFTFHEFVAPVILELAGRAMSRPRQTTASMAMQVNSEIGRTEYLLVGLVRRKAPIGRSQSGEPLVAFPMGKGSGSVTSFSRADGFVTIDRHQEILPADERVAVTLLGRDLEIADLVFIGSHCIGLDFLISQLQQRGVRTKFLAVGSTAGLRAVERGECDVAGIHLLDDESDVYNTPFLSDAIELLSGYQRQQGILFRRNDPRFEGKTLEQVFRSVTTELDCVMVNRNQGSGTRILIDRLLGGAQPPGYAVQSRSHNAVAASVAQGRSDWGIAIQGLAELNDLGFTPLRAEQYDFVLRRDNRSPSLDVFRELLVDAKVRQRLGEFGLTPVPVREE